MTSECAIPEGYKETDIGIIPLNWNIRKVGDLFEVKNGTTPSTKEEKYWVDGNINWITPTDLNKINSKKCIFQTLRKITPTALEECNLNILPKDSLIMSTRAPVGYVSIIGEQATFNQGCKGLIPKNNDIHPTYYYYYFQASAQKLQNISGGSTFKELSAYSLNNFYIPFFQKQEQHKIASILSKVDEHISHTEVIIEKTEELKKGLMQQLLTKGIGHTKFKKTEIGEIPEEWDVVTVSTIFSVFGGTTPPTKSDEYWVDGNINWVTPADLSKLSGSLLVYTSQRKITEKALKECNLNLMPVDSIIMSTRAPVGYLSLVKKNATFNQGCKGLVPKDNNVSSLFYMYYLLFSNTKLQNLSGGSTFKELGKAALQTLSLPYPPKEEQEKIGQILTHVDDQLSQNQTYLSHLQELKKGLMQDLLTGKVRVTV